MLWKNVFILSTEKLSLHLSLQTHYAGLTTSLSTDTKTYTLLTSVNNDVDDTDATDVAADYNRVIGIVQLKAFSCARNKVLPLHVKLFLPHGGA